MSGLTLWGVLLLGVAATGSGSLGRVPLAVITLTALAAFEVVTALPAAALALGQSRAAADRIADVLDGLDQVDEIVVLDHGLVAERGTHAGLIRSGGAYQRLWDAGHPGRPA